MPLPLWRLTTWRRKLFERIGSKCYSKPALGAIQQKLDKYLPTPGVFVEAGAVDGYFESNTYYLERFHGWRGILIEPVTEMFNRIAINRPNAKAFNCALVSFDYKHSGISITPAHALSRIGYDSESSSALRIQPRIVPARTLTSVLDEAGELSIDLLSLDVEGFEIQVLKGLDFGRYSPRSILIECLDNQSKTEIDQYLSGRYVFVEAFSYRDLFYRAMGT